MKKVRIYKNLHKKLYSLQEKIDGSWRVKHHKEVIVCHNPSFIVYQSGRQRVIREKRKNVHAYICGNVDVSTNISSSELDSMLTKFVRVSYNPYKGGTFRTADEHQNPVHSAKIAILTLNGVWIDAESAEMWRVTLEVNNGEESSNHIKNQEAPKTF